MKIFIVGGAVRDIFLGNRPKDIDFVVVGATKNSFISEFPNAKQIGKDFPVFLVNGEEYAFARTERKICGGHKGFSTNTNGVTLEQDLLRRDLTINSIALCPESGLVIGDPISFIDIGNKILRHTSSAFKEDPLRVFRVARFAAQLKDFVVDSTTNNLMKEMSNELYGLSPERVWVELIKALSSNEPRRFFEVLCDCNCLDYWFPEIKAILGVPAGPKEGKHLNDIDTFDHIMKVINIIDDNRPELRFAGLCHDLGKSLSINPPEHYLHDKTGIPLIESLCNRLKAPNKYRKSAILFCQEHVRMHKIYDMRNGKAVKLLMLIHNHFPGGIKAFLQCSVGDGMSEQQVTDIMYKCEIISSIKLPDKYRGLGARCSEIMLQLRCKKWGEINAYKKN